MEELILGFESDCGDPDVAALRVTRVLGREALSEPYAYAVWLEADQDQASPSRPSRRCSSTPAASPWGRRRSRGPSRP